MTLSLADCHVTVWKIDKRGKYYEIQMSSGRKDKITKKYVNSSWGFVRFVGEAAKKAEELEKGDRIVLKGAIFSREPYEVDGEVKYPKNPQLTVFNFEWLENKDSSNKNSESDDDPELDPQNLPY